MSAENGDAAKKPRNNHDDRTVELDIPGEAAFWVKWLDASEPELREAMRAVGPLARNIKTYLQAVRKNGSANDNNG